MNRRSFTQFVVALAIVSTESGARLFGMETSTFNSTMDQLARQLAHDHTAFFKDPFSFTWWLRGGEPGSPSDHLTLAGERGYIKGSYIRVRFDASHRPPMYTETFNGLVPLERAATILTLLFESSLFRVSQDEQQKSSEMRDARKETWQFRNPHADVSVTLSEPFPPSVDTLRNLCVETAGGLVEKEKR